MTFSLKKMFQSEAQFEAGNIINVLKTTPTDTVAAATALYERLFNTHYNLSDATFAALERKAKKEIPEIGEKIAILRGFFKAVEGYSEKDKTVDNGKVTAGLNDVLEYHNTKVSHGVFTLAGVVAERICYDGALRNNYRNAAQGRALHVFAKHSEDLSLQIGSGNAGYHHMTVAVKAYVESAKTFDVLNMRSVAVESAKDARACAARQGHRLNEDTEKTLRYIFIKEESGKKVQP